MDDNFFPYGEVEINYLKAKDSKLAEIIDKLGFITRHCDFDLFAAIVHCIVGQQISTKAQESIWAKMKNILGKIDALTILEAGENKIQSCGISYRKVSYIIDLANKVNDGSFNIHEVSQMPDAEVIEKLASLKGVGVWTAEMILLFCLKRQNVFSFGDLAILRGMRMVYHHRKIDKKLFEKYRRRFSPYCSVASIYFWEIAGGAIPNMKDYAPKITKK